MSTRIYSRSNENANCVTFSRGSVFAIPFLLSGRVFDGARLGTYRPRGSGNYLTGIRADFQTPSGASTIQCVVGFYTGSGILVPDSQLPLNGVVKGGQISFDPQIPLAPGSIWQVRLGVVLPDDVGEEFLPVNLSVSLLVRFASRPLIFVVPPDLQGLRPQLNLSDSAHQSLALAGDYEAIPVELEDAVIESATSGDGYYVITTELSDSATQSLTLGDGVLSPLLALAEESIQSVELAAGEHGGHVPLTDAVTGSITSGAGGELSPLVGLTDEANQDLTSGAGDLAGIVSLADEAGQTLTMGGGSVLPTARLEDAATQSLTVGEGAFVPVPIELEDAVTQSEGVDNSEAAGTLDLAEKVLSGETSGDGAYYLTAVTEDAATQSVELGAGEEEATLDLEESVLSGETSGDSEYVDTGPAPAFMRLKASDITGKVHLDAISTWEDSSGNGHDATQGTGALQPIYLEDQINGGPAVNFGALVEDASAAFSWMDLDDFSSFTEGEIFLVVRMRYDPAVNEQSGGLMTFGTPDTVYPTYPKTADSHIVEGFGRATVVDIGAVDVALNNWHVLNIVSKAGEWTVRINGVQVYTTASNTPAFDTACYLGRSEVTPVANNFMYGQLAEVLLYDAVLTGPQRTQTLNYCNTEYALPVSQTVAWPTVTTGTLIASYEAVDIVGLSNGDPVDDWPDSSGIGTSAVQASGSLQPVYVENAYGSYPCVRFDGIDDILEFTPFGISPSSAFTVIIVWNCRGSVGGFGGPFSYSGVDSGFELNGESGSSAIFQPHITIVDDTNTEVRNSKGPVNGINLSQRQLGKNITVWEGDTSGSNTPGLIINGQTLSVAAGGGGYGPRKGSIGWCYNYVPADVAIIRVYAGALDTTDLNAVVAAAKIKAPANLNPFL